MAQTPAHSKLPWKLGSQEGCFVPVIGGGWHGLASVVVRMEGQTANEVDGEANAAFIVRAVNSHAALLAALEELIECVHPAIVGENKVARARAAILLAKQAP